MINRLDFQQPVPQRKLNPGWQRLRSSVETIVRGPPTNSTNHRKWVSNFLSILLAIPSFLKNALSSRMLKSWYVDGRPRTKVSVLLSRRYLPGFSFVCGSVQTFQRYHSTDQRTLRTRYGLSSGFLANQAYYHEHITFTYQRNNLFSLKWYTYHS